MFSKQSSLHYANPANPSVTGATACELPRNSELLDQLDIDAELSNLLHDPQFAAPSNADADTSARPPHQSKSLTLSDANFDARPPARPAPPPRSFLIGGSLFEPRPAFRRGRHGLDSLLRPRHGCLAASLAAAAVFCPFTHQFIALSSLHWERLQDAGFGLSAERQGPLRVALRSPSCLRQHATALQACGDACESTGKRTDIQISSRAAVAQPVPGGVTGPHRRRDDGESARLLSSGDTASARRERLYEAWRWAPSLRRSLGDLLCAAPLSSLDAFRAAVEGQLQTEHTYNAARVLRLPTDGRREEGLWSRSPWRARWRDLQCRDRGGGSNTSSRVCGSSSGGKAAEVVIEWADGSHTKAAGQQLRSTTGAGREDSSRLFSSLPSWVRAYTERQTVPLLGLPDGSRAAFLEIPFPLKRGMLPLLMQPVCTSVLRRLARDLAQKASSGNLAVDARLYYCPLAHGVDYNGVLDLRAFRVPLPSPLDGSAGIAIGSDEDEKRFSFAEICADEAKAVPLVSLGLEFDVRAASTCIDDFTPLQAMIVLVVDNAHLLSKRAISRLVDQWTRNGSAAQRRRELVAARHRKRAALKQFSDTRPLFSAVAGESTTVNGSTSGRWQTLMGAPVSVGAALPHLRTLAAPFGDVQAVFLGYRPADEQDEADVCASPPFSEPETVSQTPSATEPLTAAEDAKKMVYTLHLCPTPRVDLLYVEEPLSAALLRTSSLYRLRLTSTQRQAMLEAVVRGTLRQSSSHAVTSIKRQTWELRSGKSAASAEEFGLTTPKGQALLYEACEAVLALLSPLDAFLEKTAHRHNLADQTVRVLTMYPTLSALRVRHVLLTAHRVRVTRNSAVHAKVDELGAERSTGKEAEGQKTPQQLTEQPRITFLHNRQTAYVREAQARERLFNQARACAATAAALSPSTSFPSSFSNPRTAVHASATRRLAATPPVAQTFALYAEPPLLRGRWWTATLLFGAPTLADVAALRAHLLFGLRQQRHGVSSPFVPSFSLTQEYHRMARGLRAREQLQGGNGRAESGHNLCDTAQEAEAEVEVEVEDVDIFHVDFLQRSSRAKAAFRVFGVRALARLLASPPALRNDHCGDPPVRVSAMAHVVRKLEQQLQRALKRCAAEATFFPLWTYRGAGKVSRLHRDDDLRTGAKREEEVTAYNAAVHRSPAGSSSGAEGSALTTIKTITDKERSGSTEDGGALREAVAPSFPMSFRYATPPRAFADFNYVSERSVVWTPQLIERRLFTLAVAQRPSLDLIVGARVALLAAVRVPRADADPTLPATHVVFPRGSVCRVVGFVPVNDLLCGGAAVPSSPSLPRMPPAVQRQVAGWSAEERAMIWRYMEQQQHASALPLLRCDGFKEATGGRAPFYSSGSSCRRCRWDEDIRKASEHTTDGDGDVFLLPPQAAFIGGYPSTHYYALPVLHLPVWVLTTEVAAYRAGCVLPRRLASCTGAGQAKVKGAADSAPLHDFSAPAMPSSATAATGLPLTATSPSVKFDVVLTDVFHPYHADAALSKFALCLSPDERATALQLLFAHMAREDRAARQRGGKEGDTARCSSPALTSGTADVSHAAAHSPISFMEDVLFYDGVEGSASSTTAAASSTTATAPTAFSTTAGRGTAPIECRLLTELALYARLHPIQ